MKYILFWIAKQEKQKTRHNIIEYFLALLQGVMSPGKGPSGETVHEIPKSPQRSPVHSPLRSPARSPNKDGQKSPKKGKGKGKAKAKQVEMAPKEEVHYTDDFETGNNTQENISSLEEDKMRERKYLNTHSRDLMGTWCIKYLLPLRYE